MPGKSILPQVPTIQDAGPGHRRFRNKPLLYISACRTYCSARSKKTGDAVPRHSSRRTILDDLFALPWWVSLVAAATVYLVVGLAIPFLFSGSATAEMGQAALDYGWIFALIFLIPAPFAAYRRYRRKQLLDMHVSLESIRNLHWEEFEKLVAEAFSRIGYSVAEARGSAREAGIHLIASAANERIFVQCKHWRAAMVGVAAVGDLVSVIASEGASGGAVVTSGTFTDDAVAYAAGKSIQLIDGEALEKLVLSVRKPPALPSTEIRGSAKPR
jgi:restriction system protein